MNKIKILIIGFSIILNLKTNAKTSTYSKIIAKSKNSFKIGINKPMIQKSIKDFGAKGDGVTNDSWAFIKASIYMQKLKNTNYNFLLKIPKGTYIVGMQCKRNDSLVYEDIQLKNEGRYAFYGVVILDLSNCNNIIIQGENGSIIKYENKLKYGTFNYATGLKLIPGSFPYSNTDYAATPGIFCFLNSCKNIKISNLEIDGNLPNLNIGGNWGDVGIQLAHIGIYIYQVPQNVYLNNINIHHFGSDGFNYTSTNATDFNSLIILDSCKSNFNGRQGITWTGGNNLYCFKTEFNNTGQSIITTLPAAGIDIEPESGNGSSCLNGYFEKCTFFNNYYYGLVATSTSDKTFSKGHQFINCTFIGTTSPAIKSPGSTSAFLNCNFFGGVVGPNGYLNDVTSFKNCFFTDNINTSNPSILKYLNTYNKAKAVLPYVLINNSLGSGNTLYDSCNFEITNSLGFMLNGGKNNILQNSKIIFAYENNFIQNKQYISYMDACNLINNTFINNSTKPITIYTDGSTLSNNNNQIINNKAILNCIKANGKLKF